MGELKRQTVRVSTVTVEGSRSRGLLCHRLCAIHKDEFVLAIQIFETFLEFSLITFLRRKQTQVLYRAFMVNTKIIEIIQDSLSFLF